MARTNLAVTPITRAGVLAAGVVGTADGHMFANSGEEFLEVVNANATVARTVTIVTGGQLEGSEIADQTVSIPAASRRLIGPFPPRSFNQIVGADRGKVHVNYEAAGVADLTTRVYRA